MRNLRLILVTLSSAAMLSGPALGQTYVEVGDADKWIPGGQEVGIAATAIEGALDTSGPGAVDIDVYRLYLSGNQRFSASTSSGDGGTAGATAPMLFLFDEEGHAVYFNDNIDSSTNDARLPAGHTLTPTAPGYYYLVISSGNATAFGSNGESLFDQPETGIGGPASATTLSGWSVSSFTGGPYRIALTGVAAALSLTVSDFLPPINPGAVNEVKAGRVLR